MLLLHTEPWELGEAQLTALANQISQCTVECTIVDAVRGYSILRPSLQVEYLVHQIVEEYGGLSLDQPINLSAIFRFRPDQDDFLPPISLSSLAKEGSSQVLFISNCNGLECFFKDIDGELFPLINPLTSCGILNVASMNTNIFFSFSPSQSTVEEENMIENFLLVAFILRHHSGDTIWNTEIPSSDLHRTFIEHSYIFLPSSHLSVSLDRIARLPHSAFERVGPMDYRNYNRWNPHYNQGDQVDAHSEYLKSLFKLITTVETLRYLEGLTGLRLAGVQHMEVMRIGAGSFRIFNDKYDEPYGLDLILSIPICTDEPDNSKNNSSSRSSNNNHDDGCWKYLVDGEEVLSIKPSKDSIALVYRVQGCNRFLPYIPRQSTLDVIQLHVIFKTIEEGQS